MGDGAVSISVLGPVEATAAGSPVALGGRMQRSVLADLAAHHPRTVPMDRLISDVWLDEPPPSAPGTLYAYVSRLRKALGAATIEKDGDGYRLGVPSDALDVHRFESALGDARRSIAGGQPAAAIGHFRTALELWRGDPYGELGYEPFLVAERTRLLELHAAVLEEHAAARLEMGDVGGDLVVELEAALGRHPFRERLWLALMQALYRQGRQADALRAYRRASRLLGEELGIEPGPELRSLEGQILLQDPALSATVEAEERRDRVTVPTNLRSIATSFLGRDRLLGEIERALARSRLVTLVGPGGVGKTRSAIEMAWRVANDHPNGTWEIDLLAASSAEDGFRLLAEDLGLPDHPGVDMVGRVARRLDVASSLLVLDNCEHVVGELRTLVKRLLDDAPATRVLATSREPIGVDGEICLRVPPLDVLGDEAAPADLLASASVRLFEERGRLVRRGFRLTPTAAATVGEVVRSLDGLPLGIEIAAAQLGLVTIDELASRLGAGGGGGLARDSDDPRHETLSALIDWSYDLLEDGDRIRLLDAAVFAGPFSAEGAGRLWRVPAEDAAVVLDRLAAKSLLERVPAVEGEPGRFRMLETIGGYCRARLARTGTWHRLEARHAEWLLGLVAAAADHFHDSGQADAFQTLRRERAEIAQTLRSAEGDLDRLRQLVSALWYWWYADGSLTEALRSMDAVLVDDGPPVLLAARALVAADRGGNADEGVCAMVERALALAETAGPEDAAMTYLLAGDALTAIGRYEQAEAPLLEAERRNRELGNAWGVGWAVLRRVRIEGLGRGDDAEAQRLLAAAVDHLERAGDTSMLAYARLIRASIARLHGRWGESLDHGVQAVAAFRALGMRSREAEALLYPTMALVNLGRVEDARTTLAELRSLAGRLGEDQLFGVASIYEAQLERRHGDPAVALTLLDDLMVEAKAGDDRWMIARLCLELAEAHLAAGNGEGAAAFVAEGRPLWEQLEQPWYRARLAVVAGEAALAVGDHVEARRTLDAAVGVNRTLGQLHVLARAHEGLAEVDRSAADPAGAVAHLARATEIRDRIGAPLDPSGRVRHRELSAWCVARLGQERFRTEWTEAAQEADSILG